MYESRIINVFLFLFFDLVIFGMNEGKNGFDTL